MDFSKKGLSCEDAKNIDMVNYLSSIGIEPIKIRGNDFWYLSPLRNEATPSFKINRKLNRWYDHGTGKGGNLIDFAIAWHSCTVGDLLQILNGNFTGTEKQVWHTPTAAEKAAPRISVSTVKDLQSTELLNYLRERGILLQIAAAYCQEVDYLFENKKYYAIGFKNDKGGYELRNRYFKGSCSPKGVTTLKNGSKTLLVFEGFIDFLSYLVITQKMDIPLQDYLILNSLAFFEQSVPLMLGYDTVRLFLDNDPAGQNCSLYARSLDERFQDESSMYQNYQDLNNFLMRKPMS
ncbi:toprim domain-containing protein [Pedobacter sp. MC2016-24]|uniref:toprim domain-containing protein n=1 Tax=Pedobacter sp. MC2016-24 TaxID=2780090 RepID=UPI00187FFBD1|nr:toprim domain-containing protein [Pedobacter sp. MC2016-24]MBE9598699.1 toprim domain-containing protein [Pedobacter sp. MC2016-24]